MKAFPIITTIGLTVLLCLLDANASGFLNSDLDLKIRFDRINGLEAGDRVLFEQNHIGKVTSIRYEKDGSYIVEISIKSNFVNAATTLSEFLIVNDPQEEKKRAIEVVQTEPGGSVLEEGAVVKGTTSHELVLKRLTEDMGKGLDSLKGELEVLKEDLKDIPQTDEYRELKRELRETAKQLERAVRERKEKMKEELLPLLIRKLEELKERLKEQKKEKSEPVSPETV